MATGNRYEPYRLLGPDGVPVEAVTAYFRDPRRAGRPHAHRNPMEKQVNERSGLYRPRVPGRIPRSISDNEFNEIFAQLFVAS